MSEKKGQIQIDEEEQCFRGEQIRPLVRAGDPELAIADQPLFMDDGRDQDPPAEGNEKVSKYGKSPRPPRGENDTV